MTAAPGEPPLGRLEQESLEEALSARGLHRDPHPEGKQIGEIQVVNQEVFSQRDWWFQFFNHFHRTTRENVLRRELLMKPGDRYDPALVEESIRNLDSEPVLSVAGRRFTAPELSSVVVILPVVSPRPGTVDLLVVTRDVWSLRFNTNFEVQQGTLTLLQTSLSENNLFGWRKFLSLGFDMDQGSMDAGPTYFDPNIRGTRLTFYAVAGLTFSRDTHQQEGNFETASVRYPLYSLASKWGGGVDFNHFNTVIRSFQGTMLRLEDLTATPGTEMIPYIFRREITTVDANVIRSFGVDVIQRVTLGHLVDSRQSSVLPGFPYDAATAALFLAEYAPLTERRSEPYVRYQLFTPRYAVYRDLDTFDLRENKQLGPSLSLRFGLGLPELGATYRGYAFGGTASWAIGPRGFYGQALVSAGARLREGVLIDQSFTASLYGATPMLGRVLRIVLAGETDAVRADTARTRFFVGGGTGLRGYAIGAFQGTVQMIAHAELRSAALPIFSQRIGALLFYDVGDAANSYQQLTAYHDFGVGLRWLIPQLNSTVIRFDWAFATQDAFTTQGALLTAAGWPGRVSLGFEQVF
jgi:hypothetical protein